MCVCVCGFQTAFNSKAKDIYQYTVPAMFRSCSFSIISANTTFSPKLDRPKTVNVRGCLWRSCSAFSFCATSNRAAFALQREGGTEGEREGQREGGRDGWREGGRDGGREGGREGGGRE